ncbi:MAG TPA: glycosyltransferase family 88 protein [Legionella sp.]|nr:glycosyltransferase family 88 protein [Legionella sp.]
MSERINELYTYNPHRHVKIWLSNKRHVFMNEENQMRLLETRYTNPDDIIHLIYDSSLLDTDASSKLIEFCTNYSIIPVDAHNFYHLLKTEQEKRLYEYYNDEVNHLDEGGNLAVASDILRWISFVYKLGTYTDFDVSINTTNLPDLLFIKSPLMMNIGSIKIANKELVLALNDCIAVVAPDAVKTEIETIQSGLIKVLSMFSIDFIEKAEQTISKKGFITNHFIHFLKNRSELAYVVKSKSFFQNERLSSRKLREHINNIMTDKKQFIEFNKLTSADDELLVINRLRENFKNQLGFIKRLFFYNEYCDIKNTLQLPEQELLAVLMKKEHSLYLKSIVRCTSGPGAIANFLFAGSVFSSQHIREKIAPYSFYTQNLHTVFVSKSSFKLHDSIFALLNHLGSKVGELKDSSWIEEGIKSQAVRSDIIRQRKERLQENLADIFMKLNTKIKYQVNVLMQDSTIYSMFMKKKRDNYLNTLLSILHCFDPTINEFDISAFRKILYKFYSQDQNIIDRLFFKQSQKLIQSLEHHVHETFILGLTKESKIKLK